MENGIFVPHTELERKNCDALREYLNNIFYR